jgi:hypothetical protein
VGEHDDDEDEGEASEFREEADEGGTAVLKRNCAETKFPAFTEDFPLTV